jgi:hypothetical protein
MQLLTRQSGACLLLILAMGIIGAVVPSSSAAQQAALTISAAGKSDYVIVLGANASPSEQRAARELQLFLKQIGGAELPIVGDDTPLAEHEIIVGANAHLKALNVDIDVPSLGDEGYVIRTVGPRLVIAGAPKRGTMYGVYSLLDEQLGCRWFTATISRIPKRDPLTLPAIDERFVPRLIYREPFWSEAFDADWAARNRMNSSAARLTEEHGGKITYYPFVHSFYTMIPPAKYFATHPEWFSEIDGKRTADHAELCLTNEAMLQEAIKNVKGWIRDHPDATIFSVSQNDWEGWCTCKNCLAVEEREGSHSGPILQFVNRIAEAVEKEYPHVWIDTLAYWYSRKPPKTLKPRPNVIIRLCSIECCFSHPLDGCPSEENRAFVRDLAAWHQICGRNQLFIWDYATNFGNYPQPLCNVRSLRPNIRTFVENGVIGIFEQGCYTTTGGEFAELKAYLMARFLWNADYPYETALTEYLDGVYGPAAPAIRRYIDLFIDNAAAKNLHAHIFDRTQSAYLAPDIIDQADAILDEAVRLAANDAQALQQVRLVRRQTLYVRLNLVAKPKWSFVGETYAPSDTGVSPAMLDEFVALSNTIGVTGVREGSNWTSWIDAHRTPVGPLPVVTIGNDALTLRFVPALGGRLVSLVDKQSGLDLMSPPDPRVDRYPASGGYYDATGTDTGEPGAQGEYQAQKSAAPAGEEVTLARDLGNGLRLERTVFVPSGDRRHIAVTSRLVNAGSTPQKAILQVHPELRLGDFEDCSLVVTLADGSRIDDAFAKHPKGRWWSHDLDGPKLPAGAWSIVNKGSGVTLGIRFDPDEVERALAEPCADCREVELTLFSPERELAPGESTTIAHRWTVR